ncbi:unnamed protein product [Sphagnum balticum]
MFMELAFEEARKALDVEEVPVGCVFVRSDLPDHPVVARSHNLTNTFKNASRHCEAPGPGTLSLAATGKRMFPKRSRSSRAKKQLGTAVLYNLD